MKACFCTLAGTRACDTCPNSPSLRPIFTPFYPAFRTEKTKRIVEKFDEKGNLIERITEE